jgi:threonine dehydrogenase-like Zn-dependent dehydrogenase
MPGAGASHTSSIARAILYAPGDVCCEERPDPTIIEPIDAIVRTVATRVCGSDLWPYRGIDQVSQPRAIGHEYCGFVEQVGDAVPLFSRDKFVIGGFRASDNICAHCRAGVQVSCERGSGYDGCQSELIRIPLADGTLVAIPRAAVGGSRPKPADAVGRNGHRLARGRCPGMRGHWRLDVAGAAVHTPRRQRFC